MSFTGKATYDAGTSLPELVDDVSDLVGLISPFDTPLLDAIGSPRYSAKSTRHEWFEDSLNPNFSAINNGAGYDDADTSLVVDDGRIQGEPSKVCFAHLQHSVSPFDGISAAPGYGEDLSLIHI